MYGFTKFQYFVLTNLNFVRKFRISFDFQIAPSGLVDGIGVIDPSHSFRRRRQLILNNHEPTLSSPDVENLHLRNNINIK